MASPHYNYYRDYDPQTGRYPQSDPIGLKGGLNTYAYVDSDPINYVDPLGLAKPKTKGYWANCSADDMEFCRKECAPRAAKSCRKWWYIGTGLVGGEIVKGYVPARKPSCNCEENFCEKNPGMCAVGAVGLGIIIGLTAEVSLPCLALGLAAGAASQ